jgi:hypothetical protein
VARVILRWRRLALHTSAVSCCLMLACLDDAPRENPLDPEAGRFSPIEGYAFSLFPPHTPLDQIIVTALGVGIADTTEADGRFRLTYAPPEPVLIVADSPAYAPSSLLVGTNSDERKNATLYLDAVPAIVTTSVTATYEALWWPAPYREWVTISAVAADQDGVGDIDSVCCTLPNAARFALEATQDLGKYETILDEDYLGLEGAEGLVGQQLLLQAYDRQGTASEPAGTQLVRVVRDVADSLDPGGLDEVGERPTLKWLSPEPAYAAGLRIKVYRVDMGVETQAWESGLLPMGTDSTAVECCLTAGDYYWVVYTADLFGNLGRSKEAAFVVEIKKG